METSFDWFLQLILASTANIFFSLKNPMQLAATSWRKLRTKLYGASRLPFNWLLNRLCFLSCPPVTPGGHDKTFCHFRGSVLSGTAVNDRDKVTKVIFCLNNGSFGKTMAKLRSRSFCLFPTITKLRGRAHGCYGKLGAKICSTINFHQQNTFL